MTSRASRRSRCALFWLVIPSLVLFVSLPAPLRAGLGFYPSPAVALALTVDAYSVLIVLLGWAGIRLGGYVVEAGES